MWWWGGYGVVWKVIFMSNPTYAMLDWGWVELWLSWGCDNEFLLYNSDIMNMTHSKRIKWDSVFFYSCSCVFLANKVISFNPNHVGGQMAHSKSKQDSSRKCSARKEFRFNPLSFHFFSLSPQGIGLSWRVGVFLG